MKNFGKSIFESVYDDLYDNGELYTLNECDGGAAGGDAGAVAGGDVSPGGEAGPGGGITSDAVLGPSGGMEKGDGCLGKGDFHVPFPVMPCLFRYPCCNGGSKRKKKKGKKTVSVKNPYVKGMKTIVAEGEAFQYMGSAREKFDEMTQDVDNVFTGVLTFNRKWRLAWLVNENGLLEFYKPIQEYDSQTREPKPDGIWKIYHTKLTPEGAIQLLDKSNASYRTEEDALSAIWQEVKSHQEQLKECLAKLNQNADY